MIRQFVLAIAASAVFIGLTYLISLAHAGGLLTTQAVLAAFRQVGVVPGAPAVIGGIAYRLDHVAVSVQGDRRIIVTVDVSRMQ